MSNNEMVSVRYMVDDVDEAIAFYTKILGFELLTHPGHRSQTSSAATSACCSPGRRAPPAGRCPMAPNPDPVAGTASTSSSTTSMHEVTRLRDAGAQFRNDIVEGPGGKQILLQDPSGNVVELFQPANT